MKNQSAIISNFRVISQFNVALPCYYYGYFKSPGLTSYPSWDWINDDYNLMRSSHISVADSTRIARNLFLIGNAYHIFDKTDYFVIMPLKSTSVSSIGAVVLQLIKIIKKELGHEIKLVDHPFVVQDYRKFWQNRLNLEQRKQEIDHKITLKTSYHHFFDHKSLIIIDDVVSTGTSITQVVKVLEETNQSFNVKALVYGTVYQWEKIYL